MSQIIEIESHISNLGKVEHFLNDKLKELNISRKTYCRLYLAVTEGVSNAIIHGNKSNSNKKVTIKFENLEGAYKIEIGDEGNGFDFNNLPDPRAAHNILKESGRGVFIMKEYADHIDFNNRGSVIILTFNK